jgi:methylenetetrahydrofolate reductase (NADPH)
MKVTEHIAKAKESLLSFEILPPLKGQSIDTMFNTIEPLIEFKPAFIDVTYHREEYVYKSRENGLLERRSVRKRPGTVGICAAIKNKFDIDAVPHIICGGFSKEETENALIDLDFLGIDNVLALRGDPIKSEQRFVAETDGHSYASELVEQIVEMNKGNYIDEDLQHAAQSHFCIGVAGYPEKHFEAANMSLDINYLKQKVDLGANYIVTQMFFDNQKFFDFEKLCRSHDINVPIIAGLKPLTSKNQLSSIPRNFYVDMPDELVNEMMKAKNKEAERQVGKEWMINQARELKAAKASCLHFYTMSNSSIVQEIIREL